jgi:hypothetical protein
MTLRPGTGQEKKGRRLLDEEPVEDPEKKSRIEGS